MLGDMTERAAWKPWLRNYAQRSSRSNNGASDESSNQLVLFARIIYEDKCDVITLRDLHDGVQIYQIKAELEILSGIPTKMMEMHFPPNRYLDDEEILIKGKNVSFGETIRVHLNNSWNDFLQATWKGTVSELKRFLSLIRKHLGTPLALGETQKKDYEKLLGTALFISSRRGNEEICRILLRNGARAAYTTSLGNSCLHTAASAGHLTIIQLLVMHGANVRCNNIHNTSPMETAINKGHLDCARWLWLNQWSLAITENFPKDIQHHKIVNKSLPQNLLISIPVPDDSTIPDVRFRSKTPNFEFKKEKGYKSTKTRPHTAHTTTYDTKIDRLIDDTLRKNRYSREHQRDAILAPNPTRKNIMFSTSIQSEKTKQIINFFTSKRNRLQSIPSKFSPLSMPAQDLKGVSLAQKSISGKERFVTFKSQNVTKSVSSKSSERDSGVSFTQDIREDRIKLNEDIIPHTLKTYELRAENSKLRHQIPTQKVTFVTPSDVGPRGNTLLSKTSKNDSEQPQIQSTPAFLSMYPTADLSLKEHGVIQQSSPVKLSKISTPHHGNTASQDEKNSIKYQVQNIPVFPSMQSTVDLSPKEPKVTVSVKSDAIPGQQHDATASQNVNNSTQHQFKSIHILPDSQIAVDFSLKEPGVTVGHVLTKSNTIPAQHNGITASQSENNLNQHQTESILGLPGMQLTTDLSLKKPEVTERTVLVKSNPISVQLPNASTPQSEETAVEKVSKLDIQNEFRIPYTNPPPSPTETESEKKNVKKEKVSKTREKDEVLRITTRIPDTNSVPEEDNKLPSTDSGLDHKFYCHEKDSTEHPAERRHIKSDVESDKRKRLSVRFEAIPDGKTSVQNYEVEGIKAPNKTMKTMARSSVKYDPKVPDSEVKTPAKSDSIREEKNRKAFDAWLSKKRKSISKQKEEESEIQARMEKQKLSHRSSLSITYDEWLRMKEQEEPDVNMRNEALVSRPKPQRRDSKYQKTYKEWKEEKEKQERSENEKKQSEESEKKLKEYYEAETRKREYNRKMEAWLKKKEEMKKNEQERRKRIEQMNLEAANLMYQEWLGKPRVKTFEDWKRDKEQETRLNVVSKAQEQMINEHHKEMEEIKQQIAKEKFEQWVFKKELSKWKNSELELEEIRNRRKKRRSFNSQRIDSEDIGE